MKQFTQNRHRRLKAAEKKIVAAAGKDPKKYLYYGESGTHLFIVSRGGTAIPVPKSPA